MFRHAVLMLATAATCVSCAASGPSYLGFRLDVRSAPPPPRVVVVDEPDLMLVEGSRVYVVVNAESGYDVFRYGSSWYVCHDGYWYRSRTYRGPYAVIDVRSVPRAVVSVPARHWKHHPHGGPPGLAKKQKRWDS